ncbi:MAG: LDH2 family malate/lactate/ureidoglycolate dehydrogenase [bacterium]|jgi:LDH2 family malate/lactate/ureidoglycolate dehydrogenase
MSSQYHNVSPTDLKTLSTAIFKHMGCSQSDAELASDVLQSADLRGIDSHGVARLSGYVRLWKAGRINAKANPVIIHETKTTATLDGDGGLGLTNAAKAMDIAIAKAKEYGSGWVAIQNSNHFGIAGYHAMKALEHDMIGMALTNASPLVAPTYSKERLLGTNPICYAIPAGKQDPVVIDMATSAAANGKLEIAKRKNEDIPTGWLQNKEGQNTNNPEDLKLGGSLLTLGSTKEMGSHKGYGLSAFVDIFSGVLSGANYGPWVPPFVSFLPLAPDMPGKGIGHFVGAMRVDGFRPIEDFKSNMDQWIERFKSAQTIEGQSEVIIPGEPEAQMHLERNKNGIPLIDAVYEDLKTVCSEMDIAFML